MSAPRTPAPAGQIANVSAALLVSSAPEDPDAVRETARSLARLFEDVVIVSADASLDAFGRRLEGHAEGDLAAALDAAREESVLLVIPANDAPAVGPNLLLGMIAWPESVCVVPWVEGRVRPACALVRREAARAAAKEVVLPNRAPLDVLMTRLEGDKIEGDDLSALLES